MTDEQIAEIAKRTMGYFVGRVVNDDLFRKIVEKMHEATGCECRCDAELNPPEQTAKGEVTVAVTVPSGWLMVTLENGVTVKGDE